MVKSFDWFTTRTSVDNSSNWELLNFTLHILYKKKQFFVPYMGVFLNDS